MREVVAVEDILLRRLEYVMHFRGLSRVVASCCVLSFLFVLYIATGVSNFVIKYRRPILSAQALCAEKLAHPSIALLLIRIPSQLTIRTRNIDKLRPCVGENKVLDLLLGSIKHELIERIRNLNIGNRLVIVQLTHAGYSLKVCASELVEANGVGGNVVAFVGDVDG